MGEAMKLTVLGGGGVRAPLFAAAAFRHAETIGLDELCLMDIDVEKLKLFGGLSQALGQVAGSPVKITSTTDPAAALDGASYVVTTLRVGGDQGRVLDERIALRHSVLGQETTGPGGFAMAVRSIPAILGYAALLAKANPQAWMFNFTNPAGMVTQALRDAGYERVVGICDSANAAQHAASRWLGVDPHRLKAEVFGLNHLSWARKVTLDGEDQLARLLQEPTFLSGTLLNLFDAALVQEMGMWLNEYLYYYYYPEKALESISHEEMTRGEEVAMLNQRLMGQLRAMDIKSDPKQALGVYFAYEQRRGATYMAYGRPGSLTPEEADRQVRAWVEMPSDEESEGYAGVAFNLIEALQGSQVIYTGLNVPNQGAIDGMLPGDVVEVTCRVDPEGMHPERIGGVPEGPELLMRSVKRYERLAVKAIQARSRRVAVQALMAHPLVQSYARATVLVEEYLAAHAEWAGEWHE
jgi:6-phospho-beta-glucosidase